MLIGTAQGQEVKQHSLRGGFSTSLSSDEATQLHQGVYPPTSGPDLWVLLIPALESEGMMDFHLCGLKRLSTSKEGSLFLGTSPQNSLEREEAMLGHSAYHE